VFALLYQWISKQQRAEAEQQAETWITNLRIPPTFLAERLTRPNV
jgi:hypothetical protein